MGILVTKPRFPEKAMPLFKAAPYKVMYGGRGGAKSWSFIRALLILARHKKLTILCTREIQLSIAESVHKLIKDQIEALDLGYFFDPQETEIVGKNGSRFIFAGIRNGINKIKSYEAIDICAVFEAETVSKNSWIILEPTIRRDPPFGPFGEGSEIWVEFNPELATSETYLRWVANPPEGTVVIPINWRDNPWFPEILRKQKDRMKKDDLEEYMTVWEGKTRKSVSGAVYAREIQRATLEDRIGPQYKMVKGRGVTVVVDLGDQDFTSCWAMQQIGTEHNAVDFYENCGFDIDHYMDEWQARKWPIRRIWLPHDAEQRHQSARKLRHNTIKKQVEARYPTQGMVEIVPRVTNLIHKINALRALFPRINFNETNCGQGVQSLANFRYGINPLTGQRTQEPIHNWASHACSALADYAVMLKEGGERRIETPEELDPMGLNDPYANSRGSGPQSWMR